MKKVNSVKKTKKVVKSSIPTLEEQQAELIKTLQGSMNDEESLAFLKYMIEVKKRYDVEILIKQDKNREAKTFAYLRVSTRDQSFDSQVSTLHKSGFNIPKEDCFSDKLSGGVSDRDGWNDMIKTLQRGDTVVVYHVDRVGRDTVDNLQKIRFLLGNGIHLRVVTLPIPLDANSSVTDIVIAVLSAIGQSTKDRIVQGVKDGIQARKERGQRVGPIPYSEAIRHDVYTLHMKGIPANEIRYVLRKRHAMDKLMSRQTVHRIIREFKLSDIQKSEALANRKARKRGNFSLDGGELTAEEKDILFS